MSETFIIVEHSQYLGISLLLILGTIGCPFPEDMVKNYETQALV